MVRVLVVDVVTAVVVAIAVVLLAYLLILRPSMTYLTINAPYVFLMPIGNGQYELLYYDLNGDPHDLVTYKVQSNALNQAVSEINSFNQRNMGTIINGQLFIPLSYEVIIGNSTRVVQIPVQGNTVLLDSASYNEPTIALGLANIWYQPGMGTVLQEVTNLQQYVQNPIFTGGAVVIMSNGIIPYSIMFAYNSIGYGGALNFTMQSIVQSVRAYFTTQVNSAGYNWSPSLWNN